MSSDPRRRRVVIGVDTHKHVHVAVALNAVGGRLDARSFAADRGGYEQLLDWATAFGAGQLTFAIEGTGSYGAGLTSAVRRRDIGVGEVLRTDRRDRRLRAKSDTLDAENAARAGLAGHADAVPKTGDGTVEMIRQIKVAKDTAVKARTAAMISLKALLVTADPALRESLQPLSKMALLHHCAALRPGPVTSTAAATKHTLRSLARRWQDLYTGRVAGPGTCHRRSPSRATVLHECADGGRRAWRVARGSGSGGYPDPRTNRGPIRLGRRSPTQRGVRIPPSLRRRWHRRGRGTPVASVMTFRTR
jgi:hypothetical protein